MSKNSGTVLVTGATGWAGSCCLLVLDSVAPRAQLTARSCLLLGFIGARVVDLLLAEGYTVTGLARSEAKAQGLQGKGVTPLVADLRDTAAIAQAAAQADAVVSAVKRLSMLEQHNADMNPVTSALLDKAIQYCSA